MSSKVNKSPIKIILIIFFILFLFSLFIGTVVPNFYKSPTLADTVELNATIKNIEFNKNPKGNSYSIYTEEYSTELTIGTKEMVDSIDHLQVGEEITFRIEKAWEEQFYKNMPFIYIVALKTQDREIVTLESYNKQYEKDTLKIRITAISFSALFLLISIHCILLLKGINVFKRKTKQ